MAKRAIEVDYLAQIAKDIHQINLTLQRMFDNAAVARSTTPATILPMLAGQWKRRDGTEYAPVKNARKQAKSKS